MAKKDSYESLVRYYEFQMGQLPRRDAFKQALQQTLSEQDLQIFFMLPFFGPMPVEKLEKKAARANIPAERVRDTVKRMIPQGIIAAYQTDEGPVCERQPLISILELQVLVVEDSPMRNVCTELMNAFIEGDIASVPMRTPYYRVLPVESTLTGAPRRKLIQVNKVIPDPRQTLPLDLVSEMVKKEPLAALSDCYCRVTKQLVGEPCGHPIETCFYFNELAQAKLEAGYAREVTYDEAISVLWDCEKQGLIHNVSNCEGHIMTLCNCCTCSCGVMKNQVYRGTTFAGPSRYVAVIDRGQCDLCRACVGACPMNNISIEDARLQVGPDNCLGCGLCVSACPNGALSMELRAKQPKIFAHNDDLWRRLNIEAMFGLAKRKLLGA
ncbi:MAG: 4Fe-4S binding protein [Anaerolineales bacterium]|nr:4Fe-4S binding protein [Anaerolineales bacterium]